MLDFSARGILQLRFLSQYFNSSNAPSPLLLPAQARLSRQRHGFVDLSRQFSPLCARARTHHFQPLSCIKNDTSFAQPPEAWQSAFVALDLSTIDPRLGFAHEF